MVASIYKSNDNGQTWQMMLDSFVTTKLFVSRNGFIFVSGFLHESGFYRSKDDGITLDFTSDAAIEGTLYHNSIYATNFIELGNGIILAGCHDFSAYYYSLDQGDSWFAYDMGDTCSSCQGIAMNNFGELFCLSSLDYSIQKSLDTGKTWKYVNKPVDCTGCRGESVPIIFNPKNSYGIEGMGLKKTDDNGNNWIDTKTDMYKGYLPPFCLDSTYNFITSGWYYDGEYVSDIRRVKGDFSSFESISDSIFKHGEYPSCFTTSPDGFIYIGTEDGRLYRSRQPYVSVQEPPKIEKEEMCVSPRMYWK